MRRVVVGSGQRLLIIVGGVLLLPAIILLAWALVLGLLRAQSRIHASALETAEQVMDNADDRLAIDASVLRTYATADALARGDWVASESRARQIVSLNPGWKAILVRDARSGRILLDSRPADRRAALPDIGPDGRARISRTGGDCPCVILRQPILGSGAHELVALLDPDAFQAAVVENNGRRMLTALVDDRGHFIGRSLNYRERVGSAASSGLRAALRAGGQQGIYQGRTLEGMESYTAYVRSPASGWSTHVAVNRSLIDSPRLWLFIVLVGGSLLALMAGGGVIAYGLFDMAARRKEEEQILRLQKGEAIGQFTSGVAHDFNNLLTVVIGNLERILKAEASPDVKRRAGMALEAAHRGARLSNQLLSFARHGGAQVEPVDVPAMLNEVSELLRQSVGAGVSLTISAAPDTGSAMANRDQLELALLNLAINARDAMNGDGAVDISARRSGPSIEIVVSDTGPGVPAAVRDRLFEPFFTTKGAGQGTGLGLAQVAGAAAQAGGSVRLADDDGAGAGFVISLPAADDQAATAVTD